MSEIYFDNSATTPLCDEAIAIMEKIMRENFGNPSSLHKAGLASEKVISAAREKILNALFVRGGNAGRLIFCGSGSEANNLAIFGVVNSKTRKKNERIIIGEGEHPSVEESAKALEKLGYDVVRISTRGGMLDMSEFENSITENTILVSLMLVNNETGAMYDVKRCFTLAKKINPDIVCHTDAVQGFMKTRFSPSLLCADLVTISSHKIHGPKGVGALYVLPEIIKQKKLVGIIYGGGQEGGIRPGTENIIGIAGFGEAAKIAAQNLDFDIKCMSDVREYLSEKLLAVCPEIKQNIPANPSAQILNITLPSIKSETMLHFLSGEDIYVSSGSACSAHAHKTSRALTAFGLDEKSADCSLRLSLSRFNTRDEVDKVCGAFRRGIDTLVRIK